MNTTNSTTQVTVQIITDANNNPVGILTAKPETAAQVAVAVDGGLQAVKNLADKSGLPAFGVRYAKDNSWLAVTPLNAIARQVIKATTEMNGAEYTQFRSQLQAVPK